MLSHDNVSAAYLWLIIRLCHGTTYRWSSVVCLLVCHDHQSCKNRWTDWHAIWVIDSGGPKEPRVRWGSRFPMWWSNFEGKGATLCRELCINGWTDRDAVWVAESGGPKEPRIRWGTDPSREGAILRGRACLNIPDDTLMWTVRKRLNRSRCRLVYGLGLAQRSMH